MPEAPASEDTDTLIQNVRWEGPQFAESFQLFMEQRHGLLFLVMVGKILQPVPKEVSERIRRVLERKPSKVVVDLTRCEHLASAGLGFLVEFIGMSSAAAARVVMLQPREPLRTFVRILGISQLFTIVDSEQEACDKLQAR